MKGFGEITKERMKNETGMKVVWIEGNDEGKERYMKDEGRKV